MPLRFEAPASELAALALFLDEQRAALLRKLDGLSDAQATSKPTSSEFCMLTLVKHAAFVERRWFQLEIARREIEGLWPPPDDREFVVAPGDTTDSILELFEQIVAEDREILRAVTDLETPSRSGVNRRWVLLHLIEELARHAGQADIIRESIDGTKGA